MTDSPVQTDRVSRWTWMCVAFGGLIVISLLVALAFEVRSSRTREHIESQNSIVTQAVTDAQSSLQRGDLEEAQNFIDIAINTADATNRVDASRLQVVIDEARQTAFADKILSEAHQSIAAGNLSDAISTLEQSQEMHDLPSAQQRRISDLLDDTLAASSLEIAQSILSRFTDAEFEHFIHTGEIPASRRLRTGALNSHLADNLRRVLKDEITARAGKKRRQAEVEREESRKTNIGKELVVCEGPASAWGASISDSRQLVCCPNYADNIIIVWNVVNGSKYAELKPPDDCQITAESGRISSFSPDCSAVACICNRKGADIVVIWDLRRHTISQVLRSPTEASSRVDLRCVVITNRYAIAAGEFPSDDKPFAIRVWDYKKGDFVRYLDGHSDRVNCLARSLDAEYIVSGGEDRIAVKWRLSDGEEVRVYDEHEGAIVCVACSPDGDGIVTGGFDCCVRLWNKDSEQATTHWKLGDFDARQASEWSLKNSAAALGSRSAFKLGEIAPSALWPLPFISSLDYSPDGSRILVGLRVVSHESVTYNSNPLLINTNTRVIEELPFAVIDMDSVWSVFSADGNSAVVERNRRERHRGVETVTPYLVVVGLP